MSAGYNGGHKRQKEVILMAGFHDIIGHDDIIRHLKKCDRDREGIPLLYFYRGTGIRQEASCGDFCSSAAVRIGRV